MGFVDFKKFFNHLSFDVPSYVHDVEEFYFLGAFRDRRYVYIRIKLVYRPLYNPRLSNIGVFVIRVRLRDIRTPRVLAYFYPFLNPRDIRFLPPPPDSVLRAFHS